MGIEAYFAMQRGGRPFAMLLKSCVKGVYGATGPVAYFENLEAPHQRVAPAAIPSNIQPGWPGFWKGKRIAPVYAPTVRSWLFGAAKSRNQKTPGRPKKDIETP